jgi:putative metallohydrolase (TIGR04338 family)
MKVRDQAGKLYAAESLAFQKSSEDMTLKECQKFVDKVMSRSFVQRNYPWNRGQIVVHDGRRRRNAGATWRHGSYAILLPKWARNEFVILHEIAHHVSGGSGHDYKYADCLLNLVRNVMGKEEALQLQAAFHFKGVKIIGKNGPVKARCPKEKREWIQNLKVAS